MITRIKSDRIITPEDFFSGNVYFDETKILQVTAEELPCDKFFDFSGKIVSPGLIDMHVHGGNNVDFCKADSHSHRFSSASRHDIPCPYHNFCYL